MYFAGSLEINIDDAVFFKSWVLDKEQPKSIVEVQPTVHVHVASFVRHSSQTDSNQSTHCKIMNEFREISQATSSL